jgi:hypothetical protein
VSILLMIAVTVLFLLLAGPLPGARAQQATGDDAASPALTAVAGAGMTRSHPYDHLRELTDGIGGRLTGSKEAAEAIQWALTTMRNMGLSNVHEEHWQLQQGWQRISAEAEIIAPLHHPVGVLSSAWAGSTPLGGVEADVAIVNLNALDQAMAAPPSQWTGKALLFVMNTGPGSAPGRNLLVQLTEFLKIVRQARAAAVMMAAMGKPAGRNLLTSGIMGRGYFEIPSVGLNIEDQMLIQRLVDSGKTVRLRLNVQNRLTEGPVDSANVVGEIPGAEHPEEIVVVCAHLDSMDIGLGATDDGAGIAMTLGAAEAIMASGQKPKRTIRFVLFTGEEQGVLGSAAYVKAHRDEMKYHVVALDHDNGQGPTVRLNLAGRDELVPVVKKFADSLRAFGPIEVDATLGGTDSGPFTYAGVPGINVGQDSPDYMNIIHTVTDTLDKVKPDIVTRDATVTALTAFWIADRPERLATPWPPEKIAKMLIDLKMDVRMKADGTWPFDDQGKSKK